MSEIDEEDESDEDKNKGSDGDDVATVEHEELVGDQKGEKAEEEKGQQFRTPPAAVVRSRG